MPIDTSMYGMLKAPDMPDLMGTMGQAMSLKDLSLQNQAKQQQFNDQAAIRQAYAKNLGQDGRVDQTGVLRTLGESGAGHLIPQAQEQFNKYNKDYAEAGLKQNEQAGASNASIGAIVDHLQGLDPVQAAKVYPAIRQMAIRSGSIRAQDAPEQYDPDWMKNVHAAMNGSKQYLENQVAQSTVAKNNQEGLKTGAEELGKFNEEVNNASSRKTTGALIDTRNRADRILSLVGRKEGESDQAWLGRLNQNIPQIGTEVGTSLAAIMQGGVPSEELQKKLSPDTMSSKIAELTQKWKAEPTAANQGALLAAYADVAQKLRGFSADRLKETSDRARAAFPYANRYFSAEMDKIASPFASPAASDSGTMLAKGGPKPASAAFGKDTGTKTASASEAPTKAAPKFGAGDLVMVKGRHYRVGPDGDSLIPIQGSR